MGETTGIEWCECDVEPLDGLPQGERGVQG